MKKTVGIVVLIILLALVGYYITGIVTERNVEKHINIINQTNGLHAAIKEYNRGWFTSQALLDWRLHIPAQVEKTASGEVRTIPEKNIQLNMPLKVYHGPIIFSDQGAVLGLGYADTQFNLPEPYQTEFKKTFTENSTQPQLILSLFIPFSYNSELTFSVPQFKLISKQDKTEFNWFGMSSSTTTNASLSKVKGDFVLNGLQIAQDKKLAQVGKISGDYKMHRADFDLYAGKANFDFSSLLIKDQDQIILQLENFNLNSQSSVDDGLYSAKMRASLDKLISGTKMFGPAHIALAMDNFDAASLSHIKQQLQQIQQAASNVEKQQLALALLPELPKLLGRGPKFEISELKFTMPEGTVEGDMVVSLPQAQSNNPFELMQKVQGQGHLKIPEATMKLALQPMVLQEVMAQQQPAQAPAVSQPAPSADQTAAQPSAAVVSPASNEQTAASAAPTATTPAQQPAAQPQTPAAASETNTAAQSSAPPALATSPTQTTATTTTSPMAPAVLPIDLKQQVAAKTDAKIQAMLQSGLIVQEDSFYVMDMKLNQGNLILNGKPFNAAMLKF